MRYAILAAGLVAALVLAPAVPASHLARRTFRCTYEVGNIDQLQLTNEDPLGLTADGGINIGGCNYRLSEHPPIISASMPLGIMPDVLQIALLDDVFGTNVGAFFCNDTNNDHTCGQKQDAGEQVVEFCGSSPPIEAQIDTDGDGQNDFGHHLFLVLNGPVQQALNCDPASNPVGATTGGVINPNGGAFFTAT